MEFLKVRKAEHHSSQACCQTGRYLQGVKEQLRQTYDRLQEKRLQLLQQHNLLCGLAEVLGYYRASLQDEDLLGRPTADVEGLLLEQLQQLHIPSLTMTNTDSHSCAASNSSVSGKQAGWADAEFMDTSTSRSDIFTGMVCAGVEHARPTHTLNVNQQSSSHRQAPASRLRDLSLSSGQAPHSQQQQLDQQQQFNQPFASDSDQFLLVRMMFDQPFDPSASTATLADLRVRWAADVQQLKHYLQQVQAAAPPSIAPAQAAAPAESCSHMAAAAEVSNQACQPHSTCQWSELWSGQDQPQHQHHHQLPQQPHPCVPAQDMDPLEGILDLQLRMFTMSNSLMMVEKENLFFELQLTDWYTGERLQEPCRERHRAALQALQLTPAQQQRMAAGWKFFQQLLAPVLAERKQLHVQGVQVLHPPATCAAHNSAAPAAPSTPPAVFAAHSGHGARLQAQREQASRLRLLGRKDSMLRGIMALYIQGSMSLVQQAKLRIAMEPYQVNMGTFCVVLMEHIQQQKLQQQGQARSPPRPGAAAAKCATA